MLGQFEREEVLWLLTELTLKCNQFIEGLLEILENVSKFYSWVL